MSETRKLSEGAKNLFIAYAKDSDNWSGSPLVGGNVRQDEQANGYLTDLKKRRLVKTWQENRDGRKLVWLEFTESGREYARQLGIEIEGS